MKNPVNRPQVFSSDNTWMDDDPDKARFVISGGSFQLPHVFSRIVRGSQRYPIHVGNDQGFRIVRNTK